MMSTGFKFSLTPNVFIKDGVAFSLSQRPLQLHRPVQGSSAPTRFSTPSGILFASILEQLLTDL